MNQLWVIPSSEVRFSVTLSPTWTVSGGPGVLMVVFVAPQPPARLPKREMFTSAAAARGATKDKAARAQTMLTTNTRVLWAYDIEDPIRRRRTRVCTHKCIGP